MRRMSWFGRRNRPIFPAKKRILLTDFRNATIILEVEECQGGRIVKRSICDDSYLILEAGGTVYGDASYRWLPYSGFTQEEIITDMTLRKKHDEQPK